MFKGLMVVGQASKELCPQS
ncbi:hypothetical protein FOXB_12830 [Fusarium oxysporum f. sp. conglutinans Fo5176]|uniref:Uncharacterized protein n=1 Tax=Fusarium oxysporum (strain Fo5176) TaxID=660025 RepID=F9G2E8_FUSOF|nr:hypothetical protein FOXB_12830 [Fusarium oxysporum f. sp. conglutinans Fo5176]